MKIRSLSLPALVALCCSMPATATATAVSDQQTNDQAGEPAVTASSGPTFGVGARVGGYGFREVDQGALSWNDCRMNGTGLFGTLDVGEHLFGELSADLYHATAAQAEHGMDRVSFQPQAAIGARIHLGELVSPYIQAGGGPEFTRIDLDGATDSKVLPSAFMGLGGELNIKQFHLGTTLKVFSMGLPKHLHGVTTAHALEPEGAPTSHDHAADDQIPIRYEIAGMMQFFVRYHF